jgi:hypothetical protein
MFIKYYSYRNHKILIKHALLTIITNFFYFIYCFFVVNEIS